uniref:Ig-like domain-containing protein n=1 Tax=Cyprinodon variegatus TaxID=28743 RepID=A0A3Q2CWJ8_CYPVA
TDLKKPLTEDSFASRGQVTVTQPAEVRANLGGSVSISCRTSQNVHYSSTFAWFQQKDGQSPKRLIYGSSSRDPWTPSHFTGSGSHTDFTLTFSGVLAEDSAVYYCQIAQKPPSVRQTRNSS